MRLLQTDTLNVVELFESPLPTYATLSHAWGAEEVSFRDMVDVRRASQKKGFAKLEAASKLALSDGLQYLWTDTCCINQIDGAELSEAINSMFRRFQESSICYVYLADVTSDSEFKRSRWFTRAWLLQQLLAPNNLRFYNKDWKFLGTRYELVSQIADITGIDLHILNRNHNPIHGRWKPIRCSTVIASNVAKSLPLCPFSSQCPLQIECLGLPNEPRPTKKTQHTRC